MPEITPPRRQLNVTLSEPVFNELQCLATSSGRTMTDLIGAALGLVKVAIEESKQNHVLFVGTPYGKPLKQLILRAPQPSE